MLREVWLAVLQLPVANAPFLGAAPLLTLRHLFAPVFVCIALQLGACIGAAAAGTATGAIPVGEGLIVHDDVRRIRDDLAPLILAAQRRFKIPAISLVLVRRGEVLWQEGFGYADLTSHSPATPATLYRTGSLAKPFTSMAVLKLAEDGAIDIDQPLNAYLPEFSIRSRFDTSGNPITVRSVMCHHSGLPADLNKGMWSDQSFRSVTASLPEEYAAFPPNLVFAYSNLGYTLLGQMVEAVSGLEFGDFMRERIFQPLGMASTSVRRQNAGAETIARGYRGGESFDLLPIRDTPAVGLVTSAEDIGHFMQTLFRVAELGQGPLRLETWQEMFEPQNADVPLDLNVINGLGWFLGRDSIPGGGAVVRHGGTTLAFGSELILLPERGLGVAVLANADGSRSIVSRLAEEILSRVLSAMPEAQSADLLLNDLERAAQVPVPIATEGNYVTDFGLISIRPEDSKLCACIADRNLDLIPYPGGWFGIDPDGLGDLPAVISPLAKMRFQSRRIGDRDVVVAKHGVQETLLGEKVAPAPVPRSWLDRVGRYEITNPDLLFPLTDAELSLKDGQLYLSYRMPMLSPKLIRLPVRPISDAEAIILGLGRTRGETLRAIETAGEGLIRYSGFLARRLDPRLESRATE